jgi:hypothetical protein
MPSGIRVIAATGMIALEALAIFAVTQAPDQAIAWIFAVVLTIVVLTNITRLRRACVLRDGHLTAQGRYTHRAVDLTDLRQVGIGIGGKLWIQTHHPLDQRGNDVLCLRMIPFSHTTMTAGPSGTDAVALIRAHAEAAGAHLDPPLVKMTRAPSRKALIFSI